MESGHFHDQAFSGPCFTSDAIGLDLSRIHHHTPVQDLRSHRHADQQIVRLDPVWFCRGYATKPLYSTESRSLVGIVSNGTTLLTRFSGDSSEISVQVWGTKTDTRTRVVTP